jgi:hypothetical protein
MLRNSKDLDNFSIRATDGEIGKVKDMYFDDDAWVMRYFVVDTGTWLSSRKVLVSPMSVQQPDWKDKTLPTSLTQAQVANSRSLYAAGLIGLSASAKMKRCSKRNVHATAMTTPTCAAVQQ